MFRVIAIKSSKSDSRYKKKKEKKWQNLPSQKKSPVKFNSKAINKINLCNKMNSLSEPTFNLNYVSEIMEVPIKCLSVVKL